MRSIVRRLAPLFLIAVVAIVGWSRGVHADSLTWTTESGSISGSSAVENVQQNAAKNNLCEEGSGLALLSGGDPGWVSVSGDPNPVNFGRAFTEAEGQVFYGPSDRGNVHVRQGDNDYNHWSHDLNAFLTLDESYEHLLSTGNFHEGTENEIGNMELEWERAGVPLFAWPSPGDRMHVWGNHIFDCGHGQSGNNYRTELHPPVGWAVLRQTAHSTSTPQNGKETQTPWTWYEATDRQGIGAKLITTGLGNTPVQATVADVFFSSFGGRAMASINGCDDESLVNGSSTENAACAGVDHTPSMTPSVPNYDNKWTWMQFVLQQDYSFFIPAPPKNTSGLTPIPDDAVLDWEIEGHCDGVLSSPANPPGNDIDYGGEASSGEVGNAIGDPTCNTIPEEVQEVHDQNGKLIGLQVTVKANSGGVGYPDNGYIVYAKRFKLAWDYIRPEAERVRTYKADFHTLRVYDDAEECGNDGEWMMGIRFNEQWIYPVYGSGDGGAPFWDLGALDDEKCTGDGTYKSYTIGESLTTHAGSWQGLSVWEHAWEDDSGSTPWGWNNDPNDLLPTVNEYHSGPLSNYAGGTTNHDVEGAHTIVYSISDITPPLPTAGTLEIGDPKYGPNEDTGPLFDPTIRVSGQTPITFVNSNAAKFEFRYWQDGQPIPKLWAYDDAAPFNVTFHDGAADGTYTVEYAPISDQGIVGERQRTRIQLDRTPPSLTVPADMVIDATEAAGAYVTYEVLAVDNLPGPVTITCDHPSGSFFLIKHVTTVTCTAEDAVKNQTVKTFTIEVVSPFGYIPDFVLLGHEWVKLGNHAVVQSGNIGAFDASSGAPGASGFEVVIGPDSTLLGGPQVAGQSVQLDSGVIAGETFYVDTLAVAPGVIHTPRLGYVPLFLGMPIVPNFTATGAAVSVTGDQSLAPGNYGKLDLKPNAHLTLTGGNYYFTSIDVAPGAEVRFSGPATVHVTGRVKIQDGANVGPTAGSGVTAKQVVFYVVGTDGPGGKAAVSMGDSVNIIANIYARNGTLTMGAHSSASGALLGLRVDIGAHATLNLDSAFDYPYP